MAQQDSRTWHIAAVDLDWLALSLPPSCNLAERRWPVDLETMLISLYVLVHDWWERAHPPSPRKPGRPPSLSDAEVLTLAILAQWPRFRSERDFHRFADAHLRPYFPNLVSHGQLNRRIRALEPKLKAFQRSLAETLVDDSEAYHILDTTLIPAIVRVRACRKGLFAGQAAFGRCVSKTEWVYGFKVALSVSPEGVIMAFGLAEANSDERPIGEFLVAATPQDSAQRAWPAKARRWAAGKRQLIEGVIDQLKDLFALERHRAKTLRGLLSRLAAKIVAYTCGQALNARLGRPLRHLAALLV